jgi:carboxylesterase
LRHLAYLLHVDPHFWMGERPPYGLKNERLRRWVRQQLDAGEETVAGPPRVSLRAVRESERLARSARQWMKALDTPTLVLHAREDEICSLHAVQSVLAGLPAEHIELCVLENSYHMITADDDRQLVAQRLAAHARACLAAQEGPVPAEVGNGP